jgi:DNA-directed RNA polymerase specialized sigma24 family protein
MLEILRSIATFSGKSSLATWVDSIAARVAYRYLSRRGPRLQHLQPVDEVPAIEPRTRTEHRVAAALGVQRRGSGARARKAVENAAGKSSDPAYCR